MPSCKSVEHTPAFIKDGMNPPCIRRSVALSGQFAQDSPPKTGTPNFDGRRSLPALPGVQGARIYEIEYEIQEANCASSAGRTSDRQLADVERAGANGGRHDFREH